MNKQNVKKVVALIGSEVIESVLKTLSGYSPITKDLDGFDTVLTVSNVSSEAMNAIGEQQEDNHIVNLRAYTAERLDSVFERILKAQEDGAEEKHVEFFENLKDEEGNFSAVRIASRVALSANYRESLQMQDPIMRGDKVKVAISFTAPDEYGVVYCNVNNIRKMQPKMAKPKTLSLASLLGGIEESVVNETEGIKASELTKDNFKQYMADKGLTLSDVAAEVKAKLKSDKATVAQIIEHLQAEPTIGVEEEEEVF